jgi:hypothetical protein
MMRRIIACKRLRAKPVIIRSGYLQPRHRLLRPYKGRNRDFRKGETMRTFVLLLVLMLPPLVVCGVVYAKTSSTDIGKPVCTHFDDASKPAHAAAIESAAIVAPSLTAASSAVASTTGASAATAPQSKGGGGPAGSGSMRTRGAARWQTFLPGMFK